LPNKFIKDSSIFFITSLVTGGLGFITLPVYTRYLSPSDYGVLALFFLFGTVVVNLVSVGLMSSSYRYYFEYKKDQQLFKIFNTTNIVFNVFTFIIVGVAIFYSSPWMSITVFDGKIPSNLLQLSYISGCLNYFIQYFLHLLAAQLKTVPFAVISILKVFIDILLSFYFIFSLSLTYMARINAALISQFIILVIITITIKELLAFRFSFKCLKESLIFSYPNTPATIIELAYQSFDKVMLVNYKSIASVGHYNIGDKIAGILKLTTDSITRVFNPFFQEKAHNDTIESKKEIVNRFYDLITFYFICAFLLICFSEELIKVLTTEEYYMTIYLAPLFIYYYLTGATLGMLSVNQIMFGKKLIYQLPVSLVDIFINVGLNIILIPRYGAIGAVIATAISALIADVLLLYFGQRAFYLPINIKRLISMFCIIILFTIPIYILMASNIHVMAKVISKIIFIMLFIYSFYKMSLINKNIIGVFKTN